MKRIVGIVLVWIALLMMGGDAFESVAFGQLTSGYLGVDSSEKVSSLLKTAITSGQTPPFGIKITSGDGPKFAHVGSYFIATLDVASPTNLSAIEEVLVRYASGDSLTVLARGTSVAKNRPAQAWAINSYFGIRVSYVVTKQIVDSLKKRATMLDSVAHRSDSVAHLLPAFAAQSGKVLSNNGTNLFWTAAAGAVSSITATSPLTGGTITTTGAIGIAIADATHTGAISNTDWSTLMAKQNALPSLVANRVLSNDGVSLSWSTAGAGTVTSVSGSGGSTGLTVSNVPINTAGTFTLGGTLVIANGGTGAGNRAQALLNLAPPISGKIGDYLRISPVDSSIVWDTASGSGAGLTNPMTTIGDVMYASNTAVPATAARLAIGAQDSIPLVVTTGLPSWGGKPVRVTNGGTGQATLTSHSLLLGAGTAKVVSLGSATNGQIPIGSTGADPVLAALTAGTGVSVTNGAGSITIANTGVTSVAASGPSGILTWSSAVTTTGTLTATATSQAANTFWGAPNGSSGTPAFRTLVAADIPPISAADITSGVLAVVNGGTGQSSYTNGQLLIGNTSGNTLAKATLTGTTDEVNITNGAGSITLSTPQAIATTSSPTFAAMNVSTGGAYTINSTSVLNATTLGSGVTASSLTSLGTIATGVWNGTAVDVAHGGTGATTLTSHAIQIGAGTSSPTQLGLGTSTTVLHGAAAGDPTWSAVSLTADVTGTLPVANGGIGVATIDAHGVLIGQGASAVTATKTDSTAIRTNYGRAGQPLVSNGVSLDPSMQTHSARWTASTDTAGFLNSSGGILGTLQAQVFNQAVGVTTPILASIMKDANSTDGTPWVLNLDSVGGLRAAGKFEADFQRETTGSITSGTGTSIAYFIPTSFSLGAGYAANAYIVSSTSGSFFDTTITDSHIATGSTVFVTPERNARSASGIQYPANIINVASGSMRIRIQRKTTGSLGVNEGCRLNWAVLNTSPDGKLTVGSVRVKNLTGAGTTLVLDTVTDPHANPRSKIILSCVQNSDSTTQKSYWAATEKPANWPAGTFIIGLAKTSTATINNNEGCTVNYAIINDVSSDFTSAQNWTFQEPVEVRATSNQIIAGTGTTTTLNIPTGTSDTITFPSSTGTLALTGAVGGGTGQTSYTTGDMLYASATNTLSKRSIGSTGQVLSVSGGVPTWTNASTVTGVRGGVFGGSTTGLTGGLIYYANPNGNSTAGTSVAVGGEIPVSGNFTLQRLHVKSNAAAGAAQSTGVTLFVNGVGTPIIATISGASATTASDDIDTFNVSADDLVTVQINPTATSGATGIAWSFEMVAR